MSRSTRSKIDSVKDFTEDQEENLCSRLWVHLEARLNEWINSTLPKIIEKTLKPIVSKVIEEFISSDSFKSSLSESLGFDVNQLEEKINNCDKNLKEFRETHEQLESQIDDLEQYTRRVNLRIYGVAESEGENTDDLCVKFCSEELDLVLRPEDISRSHRVGKRDPTKPRPIILRLTRHNMKVNILKMRRNLKINNRPYYVQEDLTTSRRSILSQLRNSRDAVNKVWTMDGVVFFRPTRRPSTIERCTTLSECKRLLSKY